MISPDNFGKYFNNLRIILKYKLETLEYFERLVRLQELQIWIWDCKNSHVVLVIVKIEVLKLGL